jgi:hypothetical protein
LWFLLLRIKLKLWGPSFQDTSEIQENCRPPLMWFNQFNNLGATSGVRNTGPIAPTQKGSTFMVTVSFGNKNEWIFCYHLSLGILWYAFIQYRKLGHKFKIWQE